MKILFIFAFFALTTLSACGFTPLYGTNSQNNSAAVTTNLSNLEIAIIPDRSGQYLRNALMDRFYQQGTPTAPIYRLEISKLKETVSDFDITVDAEATRRQLKLHTGLQLIKIETSEVVLTYPLSAATSHNVLESEFSTLVTEQSAREAALDDLARQIERRLALYFSK